jgi:hypothetical protein
MPSPLASNTVGDATYTSLETMIANWGAQRDGLARQMGAMLDGAAFNGQTIDEGQARQLISQGWALLDDVRSCAADIPACVK